MENPLQSDRLLHGIDFVLRVMRAAGQVTRDNPALALVFMVVLYDTVRGMREVSSNDDRDDASFGGRKRVTISGISRSLGLSRETTRRHVATLELADLLMRDEDGGLYLSDSQVRSAEIAALISEGETSLKILQRRSALVDSK